MTTQVGEGAGRRAYWEGEFADFCYAQSTSIQNIILQGVNHR